MKPLDYLNVEQNTEEWLLLRAGLVTSSKLGCIMANYGKAFGDPAKKYAVDKAIEQITGNPVESSFSNAHMDRGHEQEPIARQHYEASTFCDVDNGGFFHNEKIGCSPDGLVADDGLIEIKSVISSTHYANVRRQSIDPAYKWQCIGNLLFTGRKWLDFVSYCSDFPESKQIYVYRMDVSDYQEGFDMILKRLSEFFILVDDTRATIEQSEYFVRAK